MAVFNPTYKDTPEPRYRESEAIHQPESDKSAAYQGQAAEYLGKAQEAAGRGTGILLKGIGDLFEQSVKAANFVQQKDISEQVYDKVDQERDEYTQALETAKTAQQAGKLPGGSLMSEGTAAEAIPEEVADAGDEAGSLKDAHSAGKLRHVDYHGRILAYAKSLRARYPDQREYIDKEISQATGFPIANSYMNSVLAQLNDSSNKAQSQHDKITAEIQRHVDKGTPGADVLYAGWTTGKITNPSYVMGEIYKTTSKEFQFKRDAEEHASKNRTVAEDKLFATQQINKVTTQNSADYFSSLRVASGLTTPEEIDAVITKAALGDPLASQQARQLGMTLASQRNTAFQQAWKKVNEKDSTGRSLVDRHGNVEEVKKIIDASLSPYDEITKRIYDEKFGMANESANAVKSMTDDTMKDLYNDKEWGPYSRTSAALIKANGPDVGEKLARNLLRQDLKKLETWAGDWQKRILTQDADRQKNDIRYQGGTPKDSKSGGAGNVSFNDAINDAQTKNVPNEITGAKSIEHIVNTIDVATDPGTSDESKLNTFKAAFNRRNYGFISKFEREYIDEKGRPVPGRYQVFDKFTSDKVDAEVRRLDQTPQGKGIYRQYNDWVKQTFAYELYGVDIQDMNSLQEKDQLYFTWDNEQHKFGVHMNTRDANAARIARSVPGFAIAQEKIARINDGLEAVSRLNKNGGEDVNAYLLKTMRDSGYVPAYGNPHGVPEKMFQAIFNANKQPVKEEGSKKLNLDMESRSKPSGSLKEFMDNPDGAPPATLSIGDVQMIPSNMKKQAYDGTTLINMNGQWYKLNPKTNK